MQAAKGTWHVLFGHPDGQLEVGAWYARCVGCRAVYALAGPSDGPLRWISLASNRAEHIFELGKEQL